MGVTGRSWRRVGRDRRVGAVLLSLGLLVSACTASPTAANTNGPRGGATTTSTAGNGSTTATVTTTTTAPAAVAANVVAGRSAVPWSEVGEGWLLATWSSTVRFVTGQGTGPATLFLVDPAGGRYDLGSAPSDRLLDWSGSGTEALFLMPSTSGTVGPSQLATEDLRTGAEAVFSIPSSSTAYEVKFSKPEGTALLVPGSPARRYSVSGTLQVTYPTVLPDGGTASNAGGTVAETSRGNELVLQAAGGFDVVANTGSARGFLPPPPGQRTCALDGWWSGSDFLETCANQLLVQADSGGPPRVVASSTTGGEYIDAWTVGGQVIAEAGACGTTWLVKVGKDGAPHRVTVPGAGSVAGVGAAGSQLAVLVTPSCDEPTTRQGDLLEWYAPETGALRTVLGGADGGGTVDAAVVEDMR
ncbi:MAG TPA: hypothetical protein VND62_07400 [Acidimicrobiales bacterium]|nr:hypothetical protein [Acidimicrobiales bacterium]